MTEFESSADAPPTQRYVNRSALWTSIVGLLVLAGAGYGWYRYSLNRNAKTLYDYAEQCAEKKDYANAAAQFARYVQFRPDDAAARVRLAETYDLAFSKRGRVQRSIELYHEALGIASVKQNASIHSRLGELLLETHQFVAATDEADAILKRDAKNVQATNLRAKALYGQARQGSFKGKPADIGAGFEAAIAQDPGNRDTAVLLARIYRDEPQYLSESAHAQRAQQRAKSADEIVDKLVAAHPDQPEGHLARYQYRRQYHLPGAEDDLKEARRLGPENLDVLLASAEALRNDAMAATRSPATAGSGRVEDEYRSLQEAARTTYEKIVAVAADDYRGYLGLGETQWELGPQQAAIDTWQRGLDAAPAASTLFDMLLANGLMGMGRLDEAEKHLDRLAKDFEKRDAGQIPSERAIFVRKYQLLRANWLRGKNQPFKAMELAHAAATGTTVTPQEVGIALDAWSVLAETYMSLGRWAEAADACEKAVELAPKSPRYRVMAATAWMEANRPDRAVSDLRQALAFGDGADVRLALAAAVLRQTIAAPKASRDWPAVQAAVADVRLAHARQPMKEPWRLAFLEAELAQAQADSEGRPADGVHDAAAIYRAIKLDEKSQKALLPAIAMAFDRLDLHDDADRTVAAWEKLVAPPQARLLRARLAAGRKNYEAARQLVQSNVERLSPAERSSAQRFSIQLSLLERDAQKARTEIDALADFGPRDLEMLFTYAELAGEQKQPAEVERCRQKFIAIEGDGSRYGQYLQAGSLLAQASSATRTPSSDDPQLHAAREIIDRLTHQNPEWPAGLVLHARLLEAEGRGDEAMNAYGEAIRHGATNVGPYERLIDLLSRAGRNAEAEGYLDALRERSVASEGTDTLQAQLMARRGERDKALEIIRREAKQNPKNAAIQLSLGQMLMATNQSTEAVAAFQRAVDLAPDSLQAMRALALGFIETKQPEPARQLLAKLADRKEIPEVQKQLVIAEVDEILGDKKLALEHYRAACDVPPPDPATRLRMVEFLLRSSEKEDSAAGEKLLRAIVADSPNYSSARRLLAGLLSARGGEASWKEARDLLHESPGAMESSASTRRMDALLLLRRGGAVNRQQARQILNELVLRPDADMNDRLLLARLEDEAGRVEQARAQYVVVASRKEPPADQLLAYCDFLLRHGPAEEADVQIRRLEKLSADDPASLAARVRWLHARHRDGEIGPLVEAAAQRRQKAVGTGSAEKARQFMANGALYELCEQFPAAERWYRLLLEAQPESFEPLAIILAKQKRGSAAVTVCLDAAKHTPSPRAALAACTLRATNQIEEKDFQAADALVAAAKKEKPEPQFVAMLAAVRVLQDRVEEAIALYREALAAEPENVRTMNNLATLLGEQPAHAKEALEFIDRAIQSAGPQGWLLETKGEILLRQGRGEEALAMLQEAASSADPDPRMLLHLAQAYDLAGKPDRARKALEDARRQKLSEQILTPADRKLIKDLEEKL